MGGCEQAKMPLRIKKSGRRYEAEVSPPHGNRVLWKTERPLEAEELIAQLRQLGCHQTDIGDAFHEMDPDFPILKGSQGSTHR